MLADMKFGGSELVGLIVAVSFAAGLNVYATVATLGLLAHAGHHVVWIELTVIPLVLAVLHIFRLLDAGQGGEPEQLALRDHVLQGYGLMWLALMVLGLYA